MSDLRNVTHKKTQAASLVGMQKIQNGKEIFS